MDNKPSQRCDWQSNQFFITSKCLRIRRRGHIIVDAQTSGGYDLACVQNCPVNTMFIVLISEDILFGDKVRYLAIGRPCKPTQLLNL